MRIGHTLFACLSVLGSSAIAQTQTPQIAQQIAGAAPNYGLSPSLALKTAQMESDMGRDLGALGNVFQLNRTNWRDMGGGNMSDINIQIDRGLKYLAHDQQIATQALGRTPEEWEIYMVHQQGDAGGPALMKAPADAKAVDVLAPLYKNRATAERAIIGNLTAKDFIDLQARRFGGRPIHPLAATTPSVSESQSAMASPQRWHGYGVPNGFLSSSKLMKHQWYQSPSAEE